jgi:LEA14-like dessication related protein
LSLPQGKWIVYAAIGGLLAIMGGIVYYASLDNPQLEQVEIELSNVELIDVNSIENRAKLQTTFLVKNPSEKTFTVSIITYELFANGNSIGTGQYSTQDIAMPGRAAFYPGSEIPLKSTFQLVLSDVNIQEYQSITRGESIQYSVKGIITTETAWSLVEKEFQSSME